MSFLLKKVIQPWNSSGESSLPEVPELPPSPDLSHLTQDEIHVINSVIKRQEEFERKEADRIKRIQGELDSVQTKLQTASGESRDVAKAVDLRLCRLCFQTKFKDGVGRMCHDCKQRVCLECGSFSKPRRSSRSKRRSTRGKWRCKLCLARREVLCRTGGWYHGLGLTHPDKGPVGGVKKKLSLISLDQTERDGKHSYLQHESDRSDNTLDTDLGSSTCQAGYTTNEADNDSERCPSGNRTDSELLWNRPSPKYQRHYQNCHTQKTHSALHTSNTINSIRTNSSSNNTHYYQSNPYNKNYNQNYVNQMHRGENYRGRDRNHYLNTFDKHPNHKPKSFDSPRAESVRNIQNIGQSTDGGRISHANEKQPTKVFVKRQSLPIITTPPTELHQTMFPRVKEVNSLQTSFARSSDRDRNDTYNYRQRGYLNSGEVYDDCHMNEPHSYYDDDDDENEDMNSLESLIKERRMSMRRRQEKRQRKKMLRSEQEQHHSVECLMDEPQHTSSVDRGTHIKDRVEELKHNNVHTKGKGQRRDSVTRSLWGHSNSLNSCERKPSPISEKCGENVESTSTSTSCAVSPFHDSSTSDRSTASPSLPRSPVSLRIIRQDALSLNSSCLSVGSSRSRDARPRSPSETQDKAHSTRPGESPAFKWVRAGYQDAYSVTLTPASKESWFGLRLSGGTQDDKMQSRCYVSYVAPDVKAKVFESYEVLEWAGETLLGHSFDHVIAVTSRANPQAVVVLTASSKDSMDDSKDGSSVLKTGSSETISRNMSAELGITTKRRMLPRTPVQMKRHISRVTGELQLSLMYNPERASLSVTIHQARGLTATSYDAQVRAICGPPSDVQPQDASQQPSPLVVISLGHEQRESKREMFQTDLRHATDAPEWDSTFLFENVSLSEVAGGVLQLTVWHQQGDKTEIFIGEVLLDLVTAPLDKQAIWYSLEEHDNNVLDLPNRRNSHQTNSCTTSSSANLTSVRSSFANLTSVRGSPAGSSYSPNFSPEVPSHRRSTSLTGETFVPSVPSGNMLLASREYQSMSGPQLFTSKVKKKMRNTVCRVSSMSLSERPDLSDSSMDRLTLPKAPTRNSSTSCSYMTSDDDESSLLPYSMDSACSDRPPLEGDDMVLGPGQIPPKSYTDTKICGDIKLGFMVSKGQLVVDIVCAAGLQKSCEDTERPLDTYVKTYLVEGRKVIQRKKTDVVKNSFDPFYNKKLKYSACNVLGRNMKVNVWERTGAFERKTCRGEALVRLDGLDLCKHTVAWYKLFQINCTDYGSNESLNVW